MNHQIKSLILLLCSIVWCSLPKGSSGFLMTCKKSVRIDHGNSHNIFLSRVSQEKNYNGTVLDAIVNDLHSSGYSFRIIVIANGAILESTHSFDKTSIRASKSPKTGENIVTFASHDKSFEFHLKVDQISKVSFHKVQRQEGNVMQICRMIDQAGSPAASLILQDVNENNTNAGQPGLWFDEMIQRYGETVEL